MQRTNSEYGSPYLATHHFPFPFPFPLPDSLTCVSPVIFICVSCKEKGQGTIILKLSLLNYLPVTCLLLIHSVNPVKFTCSSPNGLLPFADRRPDQNLKRMDSTRPYFDPEVYLCSIYQDGREIEEYVKEFLE